MPIKRRLNADALTYEPDHVLRFVDGLNVDPRRCPLANHARRHWHESDDPADTLAVCDCPPGTEPIAFRARRQAR